MQLLVKMKIRNEAHYFKILCKLKMPAYFSKAFNSMCKGRRNELEK